MAELEELSADQVINLMAEFVTLAAAERRRRGMTECPPHVRKRWHLARAREQRREDRRMSLAEVGAAMGDSCDGVGSANPHKACWPTYVFEDRDDLAWRRVSTTEMDMDQSIGVGLRGPGWAGGHGPRPRSRNSGRGGARCDDSNDVADEEKYQMEDRRLA